jgi:large subunit ribosomal protein L10
MQTTKRKYNTKKQELVKNLSFISTQYKVISLSRLYKVRASQIMGLRKDLRDKIKIISVKNKLAALALEKIKFQGMEHFIKQLEGQNALILSNIDPFKLYLLLEKNKINLPARTGDIADDDIMVPSGNTGLSPGPVLTEFKESKIPTRIDAGSIWVPNDTIVVKKGEVISSKLASLLSRLGMKPIKAGLAIYMALYNGLLLEEKDIRIDLERDKGIIKEAYLNARTLSIEGSYPTAETLPQIIFKASTAGRSLALTAGFPVKEVIFEILIKNNNDAIKIYNLVKAKEYK